MSDAASKFALLAAQMADHETNWSLGTFGAIAEFMRDADEPVTLSRGDACVAAAVTARGRAPVRIRIHDARELEPSRFGVPPAGRLRHERPDGANCARA